MHFTKYSKFSFNDDFEIKVICPSFYKNLFTSHRCCQQNLFHVLFVTYTVPHNVKSIEMFVYVPHHNCIFINKKEKKIHVNYLYRIV